MKKAIIAIALLAAVPALAAIANMRQAGPGPRRANSGAGIMPPVAQEAMPRAAKRISQDGIPCDGFSPVMAGLFDPAQAPSSGYDVGGLKLNLPYSACRDFCGLDIGIAGYSRNRSNGWRINVASVADGDGTGLDTGCVNMFGGDFKGLQIGIVNWIDSGDAFQIGIYNGANDMQGLQIGVINTACMMQGLQIGVVNVIASSDLAFFPVVNWFF